MGQRSKPCGYSLPSTPEHGVAFLDFWYLPSGTAR